MAEVWERQPKESAKAYGYFVKYRDFGPERSMDKIRKNLGVKVSQTRLEQLSVKYKWVERAAAYDDYLDCKKREKKEKDILDMVERHAKLAVGFQQRIVERLQEIDPGELSPSDMAKWLDVATKLERLSRGEPENEVRVRVKHEEREDENFIKQLLQQHPELADELLESPDKQETI